MKFFIFLFLVSTSFFAQKKAGDTISYRNYSVLKWSDFKADVPDKTDFSASLSSGMTYKWSFSTAAGILDFKYNIEANLYRNYSWSKYDKDKKQVLEHEQLHFDITELHVRKFRKALAEYEVGRSIRKDVSRIYDNIEEERVAMQLLYDEETHHSINREAQLTWETKVKELLTQYESFK